MSLDDLQADLDALLSYIGTQLSSLDVSGNHQQQQQQQQLHEEIVVQELEKSEEDDSDLDAVVTAIDEESPSTPCVPFDELGVVDTVSFLRQHFSDDDLDQEIDAEQIYPEQLPVSVLACMTFLEERALRTTGIFRKCGLRARIRRLHELLQEDNAKIEDDTCVHDAADWLKAWFRASGPLITVALLTSLADGPNTIAHWRAQLLREHCTTAGQTLQRLLFFLHEFASESALSGMNSRNLAIVWAPAILPMAACGANFTTQSASNIADSRVHEQLTKRLASKMEKARTILQSLIERAPVLFSIPRAPTANNNSISTSSVEATIQRITVEASPQDILLRLLYQRHRYDPLISEWRVIKKETTKLPHENKDQLHVQFTARSGHQKAVTLQREWSSAEGELRLIERPIDGGCPVDDFCQSWNIRPLGRASVLSGRINVTNSGKLLLGGRNDQVLRATLFALLRTMATNIQRSFELTNLPEGLVARV